MGQIAVHGEAMSFVPPRCLSLTGAAQRPAADQPEPTFPRACNGSAAAKQAYAEALEFEQVLVNELAQQLTATVSSE